MIAFIIRRLLSTLLVMFTLSVLVFLIFFATPGVDPASQIAGRNADPADLAAGAARLRPRPAAARAVRDHDEEALLEPRSDVILEPRLEDHPADRRRGARDALTRDRGGHHLGLLRDRHGCCRGRHARHVRRPADHGHRADRHLDAGLLARRGGQPRDAEPPALRALLLAAAARLHPVHDDPRRAGSNTCSSPGSRSRCSTSASTAGCCARASSRRRRTTSCALRAPRA